MGFEVLEVLFLHDDLNFARSEVCKKVLHLLQIVLFKGVVFYEDGDCQRCSLLLKRIEELTSLA